MMEGNQELRMAVILKRMLGSSGAAMDSRKSGPAARKASSPGKEAAGKLFTILEKDSSKARGEKKEIRDIARQINALEKKLRANRNIGRAKALRASLLKYRIQRIEDRISCLPDSLTLSAGDTMQKRVMMIKECISRLASERACQ